MFDAVTELVQSQPLIALGLGVAAILVILIGAWWGARPPAPSRQPKSSSDQPGEMAPPRVDRRRRGSEPPRTGSEPSMPPSPSTEGQLDRMEDWTAEESAPAEIQSAPTPKPQSAARQRPDAAPTQPSARRSVGEERSDHYVVRTYFGTDRADQGAHKAADDRFNDERARPATGHPVTSYGHVDVSIPKIHKVGELEAPSWYQSERPGKHITLLGLQTQNADTFFDTLKDAIDDPRQAFVFVHGFSVSFEDAARRTAQLAFDLKFRGAPIFFSWPTEVFGITNPDMTAYSEAENNARWATQHFRQFLQDVIQKTGARTVHLIAHSMGNRVVTDALMELYWILSAAEKDVIGEVILTAPDIDADVFVEQIAPRITQMNSAVTLYASDRDSALATSKRVHGYPRIGDFGAIRLLPHLPASVEFIDASAVDTDSLGHSYYGNSESVISDICHLIATRTRADTRNLTLADMTFDDGNDYWSVKRETSIADVIAAIEARARPIA